MVVLEGNRIKLVSRYGLCNDIVKSSPSFPRRKTRLKIPMSLLTAKINGSVTRTDVGEELKTS